MQLNNWIQFTKLHARRFAATLTSLLGFALFPAGAVEPIAAYHFSGPITRATADEFLKSAAEASPKIRWVVVDSRGGDVDAAMDLAKFLHREGVSIYVEGVCASSCANYLFPAARLKVIGPNAVIGWHGSPASEHIEGIEALPPQELAKFKAYRRQMVRKEQQLFAQLRVDRRLLCAGDKTISVGKALGWTMPIRSMSPFGLNSVISLAGDGLIPTRVSGRLEPIFVIKPRPDCSLTYEVLGPSSY